MTGQATEALLQVRGLTKRYGAMAAINELDFDVPPGIVFGISGPNGAGKTTLFDVISGVTKATSGTITFAGGSVDGLSPQAICHLGIVRTFQLNAVFDTMTVQENLLCSGYFGARNVPFAGLSFDRSAHRRADEALEITGLADRRQETARGLPVLQRKLLMLASAIACQPRLLLLDEPVGGLNPKEMELCAEVLRRLRGSKGMTIVLIEHVMSFMTAIADHVMVLHHGRKIHEGDSASLTTNEEVVSVYLGTSGVQELNGAPRKDSRHEPA